MNAIRFGLWMCLALGALVHEARAQAGNLTNSPGSIASGAPKAPRINRETATPPPAAVPGARARPDSVAPASAAAADLPPTEALFDAINRGDIGTARDAVSRGADLDGTNLLGLTPLELSVDLGRNDISFLLLSLRGSSGGEGSRQAGAGRGEDAAPPSAAQRRQAAAEARAEARAAARSQAVEARAGEARAGAGRAALPAAAARGPALFAGNGGAAVPSAGFLGFDARR